MKRYKKIQNDCDGTTGRVLRTKSQDKLEKKQFKNNKTPSSVTRNAKMHEMEKKLVILKWQ